MQPLRRATDCLPISAFEIDSSDRAEYERIEAAIRALMEKKIDKSWKGCHAPNQPIKYGDLLLLRRWVP